MQQVLVSVTRNKKRKIRGEKFKLPALRGFIFNQRTRFVVTWEKLHNFLLAAPEGKAPKPHKPVPSCLWTVWASVLHDPVHFHIVWFKHYIREERNYFAQTGNLYSIYQTLTQLYAVIRTFYISVTHRFSVLFHCNLQVFFCLKFNECLSAGTPLSCVGEMDATSIV